MNAGPTILTAILTSTVVSAILGALLKYNFDRRIQSIGHDNQMKLAEVTENLRVVHEAVLERDRHRREVLPTVAEQVYRLRNSARDIVTADEDLAQVTSIFQAEVDSIESALFRYRILLESESLFSLLHSIKNEARTLVRLAKDYEFADGSEDLRSHLVETYDGINEQYDKIIVKITKQVSIASLDFLPNHQG